MRTNQQVRVFKNQGCTYFASWNLCQMTGTLEYRGFWQKVI